jgi:hypothetical protein
MTPTGLSVSENCAKYYFVVQALRTFQFPPANRIAQWKRLGKSATI